MARLAVWGVAAPHGEGASQLMPQRVDPSHIELERYLEEWIALDATLIAEGLTLVGRQVSIDDGRLDLLAIDSQDRWVVIEIKARLLDSGALLQALYYASSLARLSGDELWGKLEPGFRHLGDTGELTARVKQQLATEEEQREIAVLLVGAGVHPGLKRMNEFLGRFDIPFSVVSFEVFKLDSGQQLLIREVIEEQIVAVSPPHQLTVEAIRALADKAGVVKQFDRFVDMSEQAGLAVQPQRASVRIAPSTDRRRFLMYAQPRAGGSNGELGIWVGPEQFAEFFPHVSEQEAICALGKYDDGAFLAGETLDKRLHQIQRFLTERVYRPEDDIG